MRILGGLLTLFLLNGTACLAEVPAWLRLAAAAPMPSYAKDVPSVELVNIRSDRVDASGKLTTQVQYAVRILTIKGRSAAIARAVYETDSSDVKNLRAWMLKPSGQTKEYDKKNTVDMALIDDDVYNEVRVRTIPASEDSEVGSVFGFESEVEIRSVFSQVEFPFQGRMPVLTSRYNLVLPAGWRADSLTFNHAPVPPEISGSTYSWERRNLPYIDDEEDQPSLSELVPRLAVSFYPPQGAGGGSMRSFSGWSDVSQWLTDLSEPRVTPSDAVRRKAVELTSGIDNPVDRIRAIGKFVQNIQYISIQTGLGRGGGYVPHAANDVLLKSYGDCKDKANLMRSMLRSIGVPAYAVSIYLGDPLYVHPEWPSPQQFNHAIVAVKVDDSVNLASTMGNPKLGKLLFFDPTDSETRLGDLSETLQGSFALVNAGADGQILKMPQMDPAASRTVREVHATLSVDGGLQATIREDSSGQNAANERRLYHGRALDVWKRSIESWIARNVSGASVKKSEAAEENDRFTLQTDFVAPRYAQIINGRLLVFLPALVGHTGTLFSQESRKSPVWLDADEEEETAFFALPASLRVDELPKAVHLEQPFGSYEASYEVRGNTLVFSRKKTLKAGMIPASDYNALQAFFKAMRAAEQAPVVLSQ